MHDHSCLPEGTVRSRRRRRRTLVIIIFLTGLGYVPALLYYDVATEVIVATAPAVIALMIEATRRATETTSPGTATPIPSAT
jgi:hypothetical protein